MGTSTPVVPNVPAISGFTASAMGKPTALAVKPLMAGTFGTTGVDVPMSKTYYDPLLKGLADLGIRFVETELTL